MKFGRVGVLLQPGVGKVMIIHIDEHRFLP